MARDVFDDIEIIDEGENLIEIDNDEKLEDEVEDTRTPEEIEAANLKEKEEAEKAGQIIVDNDEEPEEDEEIDDPEEDQEPGENDDLNPGKDSTDTLPPFATLLKESGILPDLELTDETEYNAEFLSKAIEDQVRKNEYADLDDSQKQLLEVIRDGGDVRQYLQYHQEEVDSQDKFEEITDDNAEEFLKAYYKLNGMSEEDAQDIIDEYAINQTTKAKAEKFKSRYDGLIKKQKEDFVKQTKAEAKAAQENSKKALEDLRKNIDSKGEIIKGVKLNKSMKDKLYNSLTKPLRYDDQGNAVTAFQETYQKDPVGTELLINYLHIITEGFTKMDAISYTANAKSGVVKEINAKLEQEKRTATASKGSAKRTNKNNNKTDIVSALKATFG